MPNVFTNQYTGQGMAQDPEERKRQLAMAAQMAAPADNRTQGSPQDQAAAIQNAGSLEQAGLDPNVVKGSMQNAGQSGQQPFVPTGMKFRRSTQKDQPAMQEQPDTAADFNQPIQPQQAQAPQPQMPMMGMETQTTRSTQQTVMPESLKQAQKAVNQADADFVSAQTKLMQEESAVKQAQADKAAAEADALRTAQDNYRTLQENNRARMDAKMREYENMEIKNPWSNMGTESKILAGISLALGGIGGILDRSGQNVAIDIINKQLEKDVEMQKMNIDKKRGELTALQQYGQELRQMGADDMQVRQGMMALAEKVTANKLEAIRSKIDPQDPRNAKLAELIATQKQRAFEREKALADTYATKVATNTVTSMAPVAAPKPAGPLDKEFTQELTGNITALNNIDRLESSFKKDPNSIGPIVGRLNKAKAKWFGNKSFTELDQAAQTAVIEYVFQMSGKAATDAERAMLMEVMPTTTDTPETFMQKLAGIRQRLANAYNNKLHYYGKSGYNVNAFQPYQSAEDVKQQQGFKPQQ